MHPQMAAEMDKIVEEIESIRKDAKDNNDESRPVWPMLVLRAPKGWTGPKTWDGEPIEGSFRAHQIPIPVDQKDMEHADDLVAWLESYKPKELFNDDGTLKADIEAIIPKGSLRALTALRTPLPWYTDLSPSRRSQASASPVEAPDGTRPRP